MATWTPERMKRLRAELILLLLSVALLHLLYPKVPVAEFGARTGQAQQGGMSAPRQANVELRGYDGSLRFSSEKRNAFDQSAFHTHHNRLSVLPLCLGRIELAQSPRTRSTTTLRASGRAPPAFLS